MSFRPLVCPYSPLPSPNNSSVGCDLYLTGPWLTSTMTCDGLGGPQSLELTDLELTGSLQLYPAECSWASYLISLSLNFFICEIKVIVPTS